MDFIIIARGLDGKLYHLYVYNKDFNKEAEYKWYSEQDSPINYATFTDKDAALYYIHDKREKLENAENVSKIDIRTIGVGKIVIKVKQVR